MSIQRSVARPRIGLALGSGSARGWAHIGIIDALLEVGIEPDIVCGTSIGALVGASYVADRLPVLRGFAQALTWRKIIGFLNVQLFGGGIFDGKLIVALLRDLGIAAPIESYRKPYAAIATDLETGREIWLREGPIHDAVRASISLPGIFSPSKLADRWLVDGGLVNPVPISTCRALGADIVIGVNLNGDFVSRSESDDNRRISAAKIGSSPQFLHRLLDRIPPVISEQVSAIAPKFLWTGPAAPGCFDVLTNSINIIQENIRRARLAFEPPHVMLTPRLRTIGLLEYNRADEIIAEGRACVQRELATLRRYI